MTALSSVLQLLASYSCDQLECISMPVTLQHRLARTYVAIHRADKVLGMEMYGRVESGNLE